MLNRLTICISALQERKVKAIRYGQDYDEEDPLEGSQFWTDKINVDILLALQLVKRDEQKV